MANIAKKKGANKPQKISKKQWNLPVSIAPDGHWVTLQEAVRENRVALSFNQLSLKQQAELVAMRIESQPKFELAIIGAGLIDKDRAIKEVRSQSSVGRTLIEIEQLMLSRMMERAINEARKQRIN